MAPFSRRAMHILEYGGVEKAFCLPSEMYRQSPALLPLFAQNLMTRMTGDETEAEVQSMLGLSPSNGTVSVETSSAQLRAGETAAIKSETDDVNCQADIDPGRENENLPADNEGSLTMEANNAEQNGGTSGEIMGSLDKPSIMGE